MTLKLARVKLASRAFEVEHGVGAVWGNGRWRCVELVDFTGQKTTVRPEAELGFVRFGFPIPWITQDLSHSPYIDDPQKVALRLTSRRTAVDIPPDYDWFAFLGNALMWGSTAWLIDFVLLPLVIQFMRTH